MKLFKKLRKGFTLIELVVVIAVIAILSAVSVVSYVAITNKAHQSNDQQKVDQTNLSLQALEVRSGKPKTMYEAVKGVEEDGFKPEKFKAEANDYTFAYAMEENRFVILKKDQVVYPTDMKSVAGGANLWKFEDEAKAFTDGYSHYFRGEGLSGEISADAGVDVGDNAGISKVTYASEAEQDVVIRTKGDQTELVIDAAQSNVDFYGFAKKLSVTKVKGQSLHIYGAVNELAVSQGHVKVEDTGIVFDVSEIASAASVTNSGFVVKNSTDKEIAGSTPSDEYSINSLARLEAFRDAVNAGNTFEDLTVKLTKDIALSDKWVPIGEGTRKAAGEFNGHTAGNPEWKISGTPFKGKFDGQNHTISNLNNKDFVPTTKRLGIDGSNKMYSYGLFALTASKAEISNLKLSKVDIDSSRYSNATGDSFGAVVGFSAGSLKLSNVHVLSGNIKGKDAIGGLVGRCYRQDKVTTTGLVQVSDCSNAANITATGNNCGGIIGYTSVSSSDNLTLKVEECTNSGSITAGSGAAGMVVIGGNGSLFTFNSNENKGAIVSKGSSPRGAHIALNINETTLPNRNSSNTHSSSASVTVRANTTSDTSTCAYNFISENKGAVTNHE